LISSQLLYPKEDKEWKDHYNPNDLDSSDEELLSESDDDRYGKSNSWVRSTNNARRPWRAKGLDSSTEEDLNDRTDDDPW